MKEQNAWPIEISLDPEKTMLSIEFDTGETFMLRAEYLRTHSQSAEVKGHSKAQEVLVYGKKDVLIAGVEAVGNYAVKLLFSDGHDTGLYTWQYLFELGSHEEEYWPKYLDALKQAGKSR